MHDPACPRRLVSRVARTGFCAGAFLLAAALARGLPPPPTASHDQARDLQVMVHVRRALKEDPALAELNIGVRVRDGVATLWGPVPSEDVIPKARKVLESVRGVLGVASDLYVRVPEKVDDGLLIPLTPTGAHAYRIRLARPGFGFDENAHRPQREVRSGPCSGERSERLGLRCRAAGSDCGACSRRNDGARTARRPLR